jgi:hypothetical protein
MIRVIKCCLFQLVVLPVYKYFLTILHSWWNFIAPSSVV